MTQGEPLFDSTALRRSAGEATFRRGEEYARSGAVTLLLMDRGLVRANVQGERLYRVELRGSGKTIAGSCTCPAFAREGICKHAVATALVANASSGEAEPVGVLPAVRAYLEQQPAPALVELLLAAAMQDPALLASLRSAAALADDPAQAAEQIGDMIARATAVDEDLDYEDVAVWSGDMALALDGVAVLIEARQGEAALELAEAAIDGLERAIEAMDDESGESSGHLERACELHRQAAILARPDPVALAEQLYEWETEAGYADFSGAAELYAEVLGKAGQAEYRRLAEADWAKLPRRGPAKPGQPRVLDYDTAADRILSILDRFAEAEGDLDRRIALRSRDLSTPERYLALARFCLEQGREADALRIAEEALWIFEDGVPDWLLAEFVAERLAAAGRSAEAEGPLWRAFERGPSRRLYDALRKVGGPAAERARALLRDRAAEREPGGGGWNSPATILAEIHQDEGRLAEAWALVRAGKTSWALAEAMVRQSGEAFPADAVAVLAAEAERLVGVSYHEQAVLLVTRMAALRDAGEQAAWVAALRQRHARKHKLLRLLAEAGWA